MTAALCSPRKQQGINYFWMTVITISTFQNNYSPSKQTQPSYILCFENENRKISGDLHLICIHLQHFQIIPCTKCTLLRKFCSQLSLQICGCLYVCVHAVNAHFSVLSRNNSLPGNTCNIIFVLLGTENEGKNTS